MLEVNIEAIGPGDFDLCTAVSACIIGRSVKNHLPALADAAAEDFAPTWLALINVINEIANFKDIGAPQAAVEHYLKIARGLLDVKAESFEEINPELATVLKSISSGAHKGNAGELLTYFDALQQNGFDLAVECAKAWGEKRARRRASEIKPVPLEFFQNEGVQGVTTLKPLNQQRIRVVLGTRDVMRSSLSLEFFFFHEYLSHVFPLQDDIEGKLSEGHLFGVANQFFHEQISNRTALFAFSPLLSSRDMRSHRELRDGKKRPDYYELLDGLFGNISAICGKAHAAYLLLELAATDPGQGPSVDRVVAQLNYLARNPGHPATKILHNKGLDLDTTARELRKALSPF